MILGPKKEDLTQEHPPEEQWNQTQQGMFTQGGEPFLPGDQSQKNLSDRSGSGAYEQASTTPEQANQVRHILGDPGAVGEVKIAGKNGYKEIKHRREIKRQAHGNSVLTH